MWFFHPPTGKPCHAFLNVYQIPHPHTGNFIAQNIEDCLAEWNIDENQLLMFITDNGSNRTQAIKDLVKMQSVDSDGMSTVTTESDSDDSEADDSDSEAVRTDEEDGPTSPQQEDIHLRRFPRLAHTLQLVIKVVEKHEAFQSVLSKAKRLVKAVSMSSVAT